MAKSYNALCDQLVSLIRRGRALPGAIAPTPIAREGLFKLDVDDDIWQDIGLDEEDSTLTEIPGWLGDENIRDGIRARLDLDRCLEEEERIKGERCSMQEWMLEEWAVLQDAQADAGEFDRYLRYFMALTMNRVSKRWWGHVVPTGTTGGVSPAGLRDLGAGSTPTSLQVPYARVVGSVSSCAGGYSCSGGDSKLLGVG